MLAGYGYGYGQTQNLILAVCLASNDKEVYLGWIESITIPVDVVCLLDSMAAAHCLCLLICFLFGNPGYSENSGSHGPKQQLLSWAKIDISKEKHTVAL